MMVAEGAKVVLTDIQDEKGRALAAELGDNALYMHHDVRDADQWKAVVEKAVSHFGGLNVLVNNAGVVKFATIETCSIDEFRFQNDIMVEGTFLGCQAAIPAIAKSGGGSIVNISSIGGLKGISAIVAYAAAKAAIAGMTRSIAAHCQEQKYGINVNSIAPGAHETPMTASAMTGLAENDPGLDQVKAHGQGKAEDVANLVVFLSSPEARQITAQNIVIDNGETVF
jgi:3(or 17)beta-hydroxysteroid dehydrogenase